MTTLSDDEIKTIATDELRLEPTADADGDDADADDADADADDADSDGSDSDADDADAA